MSETNEDRKVNVEHLLKIKAHVLEEPKRLAMSEWLVKGDGIFYPACGTAACIAGWSHILRGLPALEHHVNDNAEREFLGLDSDELFYVSDWPSNLVAKYNQGGREAKAAAAGEAIDMIIEGNGSFPKESV